MATSAVAAAFMAATATSFVSTTASAFVSTTSMLRTTTTIALRAFAMKAATTCAAPVGLVDRRFAEVGRDSQFGYFTAYEFLYAAKALHVHRIDEGDGSTGALSACCTAYTVYVVFAIRWYVVVDDQVYAVDIYTT